MLHLAFAGGFWSARVSQVPLVVRNLPANAEDVRDAGSILGSGRSPGGGHGNPLQYSCLENPMDRGAWWATVHGVAESATEQGGTNETETETETKAKLNTAQTEVAKERRSGN